MAIVSLASLKAKWITGYKPTQSDYIDMFDTLSNFETILGLSPSTGELSIKSPNNYSQLQLRDTWASLVYLNTGDGIEGGIITNIDKAKIFHSTLFSIESPLINWIQKSGQGKLNLFIDDNGVFQTEAKPLVFNAIISQINNDDITFGIYGNGDIIQNDYQISTPTVNNDGVNQFRINFPDMVGNFDANKTIPILSSWPITGEDFGGVWPYFSIFISDGKQLTINCKNGNGMILNQQLTIITYP